MPASGRTTLEERFIRYCEISSPTEEEREIADHMLAELESLGIEAAEDDCAEAARAGAGNILARVPGRGDRWIMFCAHLDTVPHDGPIEVVESDGVFGSAGETILGADNKAAVAVLVEMAARLAAEPAEVGLELLLTVAEEDGLRGAHAFDVEQLRSDRGYVLDHATPIGELITAAPTYKKLTADFRGIEAHAGIRPEAGRSAIAAASAAVAAMQLGRLDDETTANIGLIDGGTAANVVPGVCTVVGEARSIGEGRVEEVLGQMIEACTWAAGEARVDVDLDVEEMFHGYRVPASSPALQLAAAGLERTGIEPREVHTGGGSDANAFRLHGFDAVLLANGTEANHTPDESVASSELARMLDVCEAIMACAGDESGSGGDEALSGSTDRPTQA